MISRYRLVVNGLGHAFLREFGCSCARCREEKQGANTSVSIVGGDPRTDRITWHALVDVGLGVNTSLCNYFNPDEARIDQLLLSHWHPDHTLEINRLGETARRTAFRRGEKYTKIPTWCRNGTARWLQKNYSYEWYRHLLPHNTNEASHPGSILDAVPLEVTGLKITPVAVSHVTADIDPANFKDRLYCSAFFVVEAGGKKAVLLWDADGSNDWILDPDTPEREEAVTLISGADYLFIDCFSWNTETVRGFNTGHLSFNTVRKFAAAIEPRRTLLVHMSGHEDGEGNPGWGWTDEQWTEEAQKIWRGENLPGSVRVPAIGDEFPLF